MWPNNRWVITLPLGVFSILIQTGCQTVSKKKDHRSVYVTDAQGACNDPDWAAVSYMADRKSVNESFDAQAQKGQIHAFTLFDHHFESQFGDYTENAQGNKEIRKDPNGKNRFVPGIQLNQWGKKQIDQIVCKNPGKEGAVFLQMAKLGSETAEPNKKEWSDWVNDSRTTEIKKYLAENHEGFAGKIVVINIYPDTINSGEAKSIYSKHVGGARGFLDDTWKNGLNSYIPTFSGSGGGAAPIAPTGSPSGGETTPGGSGDSGTPGDTSQTSGSSNLPSFPDPAQNPGGGVDPGVPGDAGQGSGGLTDPGVSEANIPGAGTLGPTPPPANQNSPMDAGSKPSANPAVPSPKKK